MKLKGFTRGLLLAGLALTAGLGGAYFADRYVDSEIATARAAMNARYEPRKVVVAKHDLSAGAPLDTSMVAIREVPQTFLHADAVRANQWSSIAGRALAVPVNAGEAVLTSHLSSQVGAGFSTRVPEGMRALTIPMNDQSSISGMLSPDDHIDLMVTLADKNDTYTFPLLRDVRVIATGTYTNDRGASRSNRGAANGYRNATVVVSPLNAARITHAMDVGEVTVTMRAAGDRAPSADFRIDKARLFGRSDRTAPEQSVEIIIGGQ